MHSCMGQFLGQWVTTFKVKGQLVADVLNSQHAGTGATWRINTKILSTCRGRRYTVLPRTQHCWILSAFWLMLLIIITSISNAP